jgi:hypothetical protein
MENNQLDILQGGHVEGVFFNASKPITASNYKLLYFQEDSVINTWTDTADVNQKTLWNIGTETIKAGTILFAKNSKGTKAIALTSGSGFAYGIMS